MVLTATSSDPGDPMATESQHSTTDRSSGEGIGFALLEAVFATTPADRASDADTDVVHRLETFHETYPNVGDDLQALINLGEAPVREVMGEDQMAGRLKSEALMDVAMTFANLDPRVSTAADAAAHSREELEAAYTAVPGLGAGTFEQFLTRLGLTDSED